MRRFLKSMVHIWGVVFETRHEFERLNHPEELLFRNMIQFFALLMEPVSYKLQHHSVIINVDSSMRSDGAAMR